MCRQEAIKQAEKERRKKYKAQDDEREVNRSAIREKYNIAAPVNEEEEESDEEDEDGLGPKKKEEEDEDPVERKYLSRLSRNIFIMSCFNQNIGQSGAMT